MCLELRLRSLCLHWAKIRTPTWLIATISAVSLLPVAQANVGGTNRGTSAVTYHTSQGTYFAFHNDASAIRAYKITPTNPPAIVFAWSMSQSGRGSPWVTTTDGTNNAIVWVAGVARRPALARLRWRHRRSHLRRRRRQRVDDRHAPVEHRNCCSRPDLLRCG